MKSEPVPAHYYESYPDGLVACGLCPHNCFLRGGAIGICGARKNRDGILYALTYGQVTSAMLDPVEKKPLYHFFPGQPVYSIGGWGCNLKCVFCQNSPISQYESPTRPMTPREVARAGMKNGSVGVAYTYNEPVVAIEYVMACAKEVRKLGGKNILVTNCFINPEPLEALLPLIDAMNIDVKAFNNDFYKRLCGGALEPVLEAVQRVTRSTHVELTTLLIPNENDAVPELEDLAKWVAASCGKKVPCHLTAYHPSYNYTKTATTTAHLTNAWRIFKTQLDYVYLGNVIVPGASNTFCANCDNVVIARKAFDIDTSGMNPNGTCANCGADNNIVVA